MRLVWVLAIACLMAATSARPLRAERSDPHAAQLSAPPASVAVVARRQTPQVPELRIAPFVIAAASPIEAPILAAAPQPWLLAPADFARDHDIPCARGPPMA